MKYRPQAREAKLKSRERRRREHQKRQHRAAAARHFGPLPPGRLHGETCCACCVGERLAAARRAGGEYVAAFYSDDSVLVVATVGLCGGWPCRVDHQRAARLMLARVADDLRDGVLPPSAVVTSPGWDATHAGGEGTPP